MRTAIFAGSFDPFTRGHLDIVYRSHAVCDQLYITIEVNDNKKTLFSEKQRLSFIKEMPLVKYEGNDWIKVSSFHGLLVDYAKSIGATLLIRGVRSVSDFDYESNLAQINKTLAPEIETIFIPTDPKLAHVSSSMVKELAKYGTNVSQFVESHINDNLKSIFAGD